MADVTYYLKGLKRTPGVDERDMVFYSSAIFPSIPGRYKLPWKCGTLYVDNSYDEETVSYRWGFSDQYVRFLGQPRPFTAPLMRAIYNWIEPPKISGKPQTIRQIMTGAGKIYQHDNAYVDNEPISRITTGYFSYEYGRCRAVDFVVKRKFSVGDPKQKYPNI